MPTSSDADTQLPRGQDRAFDFRTRGMVASHGIQGNGNHLSTNGLQSREFGKKRRKT